MLVIYRKWQFIQLIHEQLPISKVWYMKSSGRHAEGRLRLSTVIGIICFQKACHGSSEGSELGVEDQYEKWSHYNNGVILAGSEHGFC